MTAKLLGAPIRDTARQLVLYAGEAECNKPLATSENLTPRAAGNGRPPACFNFA
jgi:hypothetical protein